MWRQIKIAQFLCVLSLIGCTTGSGVAKRLCFDNDKPVVIDLTDCEKIHLGGTRIGAIENVLFFSDRILFFANDNLHLYDLSGNFIKQVSSQGKAYGEYISLWNVWTIDSGFCAYDINGKQVLQFDSDGNFIKSTDLLLIPETHFQFLAPLGDSYNIGKCGWRGFEGYPELALYDDKYEFVHAINEKELTLKSGIKLNIPFAYCSDTSVLFNRIFDNKIYEVTKDTAVVKFDVDFGKQRLEPKNRDEYEIIDYINSSGKSYSYLISNMELTESYFAFSYLCKKGRRTGVYDLSADCGFTMSFGRDYGEEHIVFNKSYRDAVYVFTQDQSNTYMYVVPDMLAKASGRD